MVEEITALYATHPKLHDMMPAVLKGYLRPPQNPDECTFAKTTECLSSDLERRILPCQDGGDPDCTQCGCLASVGLAALADYKVGGVFPLRTIFNASLKVGDGLRGLRGDSGPAPRPPGLFPEARPAGSERS